MKKIGAICTLCSTLSMLQACTTGPNYMKPTVETPAAFKEAPKGWKVAQPSNGVDRGPWWGVYKDPLLNELVPQVAINNQNLKAYEAAYREAQAVIAEARSGLFPSLSINPGVTRERSAGITQTTGTAEGSASWDLDLWGKVRRQIESDKAGAQASAAELADLTLTAQAQLVTDYFELRYQDSLIDLLNATAKAYQETLTITQNQYASGVAARSDVITAQTQLATTQASAIAAQQLRAQYEHAIALLIGKPPSELSIRPGRLAQSVPAPPAAIPSSLLERRPDIAEAERTMQQQNALIGVAVAAYYPTVSLSALAGYSGASPLFSATNAIWSLGASASETLFDGGERSAAVKAARATYDQSVANYRQTVLSAFQNVEDQLSNLRILKRQAAAQDKAVRLSRQAVTITINEYKAGTGAYTSVVTAQATALSNEQAALQIREGLLTSSASLIEALGGNWSVAQLPKDAQP
ncbi:MULTISPECIES: efflux transporter outer membrane subunit [unclassified Rhizobium]|jgi:NodT family efflux transporter outer membrane factor (OMF) lipoprotein|uniref:efflux transporter outer membrane subunit n=1 Tax=unclassified Rhizobium TaxID=2613769 RepID=UPI000649234B|nr:MULTISPECIES: efflux transporter outer membrane subunit [unclassified Rhizobium]MBN8954537.1 efflux transporter outer membrane subunit [Rhizobium tropici]OJY73399.1 MAG: RND transporter [Rhizobium sp. 60-20]RKD72385.1 NodT family efflux transporter outer membrane factor (OMF) lipoprotein [Rhizobium sp. WW_1]